VLLAGVSVFCACMCPQLASVADADEGLGPNSAAASAARAAAEAEAVAKVGARCYPMCWTLGTCERVCSWSRVFPSSAGQARLGGGCFSA